MTAGPGSPRNGPPGLALLLERGSARLVASGFGYGECEVAVGGAPRSVADCRGRTGAVTRLRARVPVAAIVGWVQRGWPSGQVHWDMSGGTGVWTLEGGGVWWRIEPAVRVDGGLVRVRPRRSWLLGPPGLTAARAWLALARRLVGCGVRVEGGALVIDVARAAIGRRFAAAGWRVPGLGTAAVRVTGEGVEVVGGEGCPMGQVGWSSGQIEEGWSEGPVDVLADVRGWLCGSVVERGRASERLRALAAELPAVAGPLARARATALRFVDRAGCVAAVRDWLAAEPCAEAWWWLAVQSRGTADGLATGLAGLADVATSEVVRVQRVLALAQALGRVTGRAAEARTLLEPRVLGGETPAEVWRTVARLRAADPAARATEVEAALTAALGEDGWRHRSDTGDLRGSVAEAVMRSGRTEASMTALLRRILIGRRKRASGEAEVVGMRQSTQIVADYYAQDGRWRELVALLEREVGRMDEAPRAEALRRIARIRRHYLPGELAQES